MRNYFLTQILADSLSADRRTRRYTQIFIRENLRPPRRAFGETGLIGDNLR